MVMIYDSSVHEDALAPVFNEMKKNMTAFSVFDLGNPDLVSRQTIENLLGKLDGKSLGNKFLCLVSKSLVDMIRDVVRIHAFVF